MSEENQTYICQTCQNCMKIKEKMNAATNEYKLCRHNQQINCDAVVSCNKYAADECRSVFREIIENDKKITELSKELYDGG